MEYERVVLNCYLVRELGAMTEIATALEPYEDADAFIKHAKELRHKIDEVFWDEKNGFYYVATIGNITETAINKYIQEQSKKSRKEDNDGASFRGSQ